MTRRLAILACVACCAAPAWAEPFPYTANVIDRDVYLRSGPGESYYPVAKLQRGQQVEVYRRDPGGWCAIRPPAGCFSWVSAEFIEPRHGNVGVVTGERVVVRVGSAFSDTRDVIQVRLHRGEEVEIIEARDANSGSAARTWYKVSPPAGEFRWVSARFLDRQTAEPKPRDPMPERDPQREVDERDRDDDSDRRLPADWEDEGESSDDPVHLTAHETPPPERREPPIDLTGAELRDADDLDLALSAVVAGEPAEWDLAGLRRRVMAALDGAETALERGQIRRVLRKIDNFAEIQRRHLAVMEAPGGAGLNRRRAAMDRSSLAGRSVGLSSLRPAGLSPLRSAGVSPLRSTGLSPLRYDGVGRLTQLASADPRLPQFALVDAEGKVAAYVSPAPGVNLRRYLNQEVGINGALGYLPERQAQHLTAKRIVPVEGRPLR